MNFPGGACLCRQHASELFGIRVDFKCSADMARIAAPRADSDGRAISIADWGRESEGRWEDLQPSLSGPQLPYRNAGKERRTSYRW